MIREYLMRPCDIIVKKRDGKNHTEEEINYLIEGYTNGAVPDYQMSAWLMASFLNGLNEEETYYLTRAMLLSGKTIDLGFIDKPKVDKHSTGGVGDKISLILAPAVAACGVLVPMTSGRGLGFSGGTLDKLESIPGYDVDLSEAEFVEFLQKVGFAMTGQTDEIAPADKKLYALRDVTGTVENISLITSSILSKKLAEGADSIVFDVKFGSGAFMKSKEDATKLAHNLTATAKKMGKKAICVLTSMDQPLGRAVGNTLEVIESIECLTGAGQSDLMDVTSILGAYMLLAGEVVESVEEGEKKIREKIKNGEAFNRFIESVRIQGGNVEAVLHPEKFQSAQHSLDIISYQSGFVTTINTESIGTASMYLGAGRLSKEDFIDHSAGIIIYKKIGDFIKPKEKLATLYYNRTEYLNQTVRLVEEAYTVEKSKASNFRLIHEVIQ
jgi:pyrimidine-nucleoside phosphorylase